MIFPAHLLVAIRTPLSCGVVVACLSAACRNVRSLAVGLAVAVSFALSVAGCRNASPEPESNVPAYHELFAEAHPAVQAAVADAVNRAREAPSAATWGRLGQVLLYYGGAAQARECFAHAARVDSAPARWLYLQGVSWEETDRERAAEFYAQAVAADDTYPPLQYRLGRLLARAGRDADAQNCFGRAIDLAPAEPAPRAALGRLLLRAGDAAAAYDLLSTAVQSPRVDRSIVRDLLLASEKAGRRESLDEWLQTLHFLPAQPATMRDDWLGEAPAGASLGQDLAASADALLQRGRFDEAIALLQELVDSRPDWARARLNLGQALLDSGAPDRALQVLAEAVEHFPEDAPLHYLHSLALQRAGRTAEALAASTRAAELKPDYAEAWYVRGLLLTGQGDAAAAIDALQRATAAAPQLAPAWLSLGLALAKSGDRTAAEHAFEQAIRLAPGDPVPRQARDEALGPP